MVKKNYEPWQFKPVTRTQFAALSLREKLMFLCRLGHLAPSSHNSQPWRFYIDSNPRKPGIDVYLDRRFVLPASDVAGRQAAISIGCAIENMVVGLSFLHGAPDIEIVRQAKSSLLPLPDRHASKISQYVHLARLNYVINTRPLPLEDLYASIFSRKVTRAEFDPQQSLSSELIGRLSSATDRKKTKLYIITDAIRRMSIAEFQGQADGFVINSPRFSKELGAWLLPNDTDAPLGMPGIGFGLHDDEATRIHRGLLGESPLRPEDSLKFALGGKVYMEKSPFIGCIVIPKDEVAYWIEAGRSFERMFLILESAGVSVAIHAGIIEVGLVTRIFGAMLGTFRRPAVLFRAGIVKNKKDKERPHSPRLPIESVILPKRYA